MLPIVPRLDFTFSHFDVDDVKVGTTGTGQILAGVANLQMVFTEKGVIDTKQIQVVPVTLGIVF